MSFFQLKKTRPLFAHQTIFFNFKPFYPNSKAKQKPLSHKGFQTPS